MNPYYLISQLPSLDAVGDNAPLPITEERLYALCADSLNKRTVQSLRELTLTPPREAAPTGVPLTDRFYEGERQLRLALAQIRAQRLQKKQEASTPALPLSALRMAEAATELQDPLAAEQLLNRYRLSLLEDLRPADAFSISAVFYYALKLKLLTRIRRFDSAAGEAAYRNIYRSILKGDGQEAKE